MPFPFPPPHRFSSSAPEPRLESRHLYPGHHIASNQQENSKREVAAAIIGEDKRLIAKLQREDLELLLS